MRVALIALLLLASCAPDQMGAVSVRWRLVDANGTSLGACEVGAVQVDEVRLVITLPPGAEAAGSELACPHAAPQSGCFVSPCLPLEYTTPFQIPEGNYLFSLQGLHCSRPVGQTPPAVARAVRHGEITNLNAIEISVPAGTSNPACDGDIRD